ncbi:MAG: DUF362 domain-containing protein [Desulfomicrobium sp.]
MIKVFLRQAPDYSLAADLVPELLDSVLPDVSGSRLLIKPNFVALRGASLCCTHPAVIAAVARHCLERGARVVVGDSPAFGTAQAIAQAIGLPPLLRPLGVEVVTLGTGVKATSAGVPVRIAAEALDADLIVNLPKFKAHSQMRFSGAVKNLFGCVTGVRKAWLHARHGDKKDRFVAMICGLLAVLPPTVSLMDAVTAMHRTGPIAGDPFPLGLLGACANPVAMDTAAAVILGAREERFPIWRHCRDKGFSGADAGQLEYPLDGPENFDATGFVLPERLKPESFRPDVLLKSLLRRAWLGRR